MPVPAEAGSSSRPMRVKADTHCSRNASISFSISASMSASTERCRYRSSRRYRSICAASAAFNARYCAGMSKKASAEIPRWVHSAGMLAMSGRLAPASQFVTAFFVTPSSAAS